jgi:anti-sigma B factor antagonist
MLDSAYVQTRHIGHAVVAVVKCQKVGDYEAPPLLSDLQTAAPSARWNIIVDMTEVQLLGSQGLGVLITLKKNCDANKGKLVLTGLSEEIVGMLKLTSLLKLFTVRKSVDDASGDFA